MKSTTKDRLYSCVKARYVPSEYDIYSDEIWKLKRELDFCENTEMVYDVLIGYYTSGMYQRHLGQGFDPLISTSTVEVLRKIIEQREKEEKKEMFELAVKAGVIKYENIKRQRYKTGSFTTDDLNYGVPVLLSILVTLIVVTIFKL